jgi:hypothetical protein
MWSSRRCRRRSASPLKLRTRSRFPDSSQFKQFIFASRGQSPIFLDVRDRTFLDSALDETQSKELHDNVVKRILRYLQLGQLYHAIRRFNARRLLVPSREDFVI